MKLSELRPDGENFYISLGKLTGREVADVLGYAANEFGEPSFKVCRIIFADGSSCGVEGEHDFPYLVTYPDWPIPGLDQETLQELDEQGEEE